MKTFTIHEPPFPEPDRLDRAVQLRFVPDGFSWVATVLTAPWLLIHRLWLPSLGFFVLATGSGMLGQYAGIAPLWPMLFALALQIFVGFEAGALRRWKLDRMGWRIIGTVSGRDQDECERRFFEAWLPGEPAISLPSAANTGGEGNPSIWPLPWRPRARREA